MTSKRKPAGNRHPQRVPPEHWPEILAAIATLRALLEPNLPVVDTKRRRTMLKMGADGMALARKCAAYGRTCPQFLPPVIDIDEFDRNLQDVVDLERLGNQLDQLRDLVKGAALHRRAQAMAAAFAYFGGVQTGARLGVDHAPSIQKDLGQHIRGGRPRKRRSPREDGST